MRTFCPILAVLSLTLVSGPARADAWARGLAQRTASQLDESLSRAAQRHARAIAARPGAPPDDIRGAVALEGLADPQLSTFAAQGRLAALTQRAETFGETRARALGASHVGVGRAALPDGGSVLVVVWSRRLVDLPPLSAQVPLRALTVVGRLRGGDRPRAFATVPSGEVHELEVVRTGRQISVALPLDGARGRYDFELLVETTRGPELGALWRFAVEVPAPGPPALPALADAAALRVAIDALRHALGAPGGALGRSAPLDQAAAAHASHVCATGIAAHVLDGRGPDARAQRAGWAGAIAENVAVAPSIGAAHAELLGSPSHRRNVLLEEARALGIGVARDGDRVCVVEVFGLAGPLTDSRPTTSR